VPGSQHMREQQHPYHFAYRWPVCTHDTSSGPAHTLLGSLPAPVNPSGNILAPYMHTYKSTQTACVLECTMHDQVRPRNMRARLQEKM